MDLLLLLGAWGPCPGSEMLKETGYVNKTHDGLRILGEGELKKKLTVKARHFSESARRKIEAAGGTAEEVS